MARVVIPGFRKIETSGGGEGGTTNYDDLTNKPSINNVPLVGNLNTVNLNLTDATLTEEGVPAEAKIVGAKLEEQSTSLTTLSGQLGSHTVKSDVPENAVFTDTVYDDTEVQKRISDNGYGEVAGGKNLLKPTLEAITQTGITLTQKNNKIHIEGTSTENTFINFVGIVYLEKGKKYKFLPANIGKGNIYIQLPEPIYQGTTFTWELESQYVSITINVWNAQTVNTDVVLMITDSIDATLNDFEPYFPSNKMLAEEKADKSETTVNLLNPTLGTTTVNGITCTNNGDGTYTLNGTADSNATFILKGEFNCSQFIGMKLVGCHSGAVVDGVRKFSIVMEATASPWNTHADDIGNGSIIVGPSGNSNLFIIVYQGATVNNLVFKPMITTNLDATYDDFVSYTGDGDTLAADVADIKNDLSASNAGAHNSVYRGKYLGNALTTEQKSQISAGTFNDLYIGDYWTIGGVNYRIAAFDYWLNSGDTNCTTHHIVIVPDTCLYNARMNTTNTTTGAYIGSEMYKTNLEQAKTTIRNAFGTANILTHRELLTNTTSENRATNWSWYDSDIELMNESMVYGSPVGSKAVDNSINFNVGIDKSQLALFRLDPSRICNRAYWWLRCVVSATTFAVVYNTGGVNNGNASIDIGVRPAFAIKG